MQSLFLRAVSCLNHGMALWEGAKGWKELTMFCTQRSYGTFTDRSIAAFHSAASRLKVAPGNHAGMYRTMENL